MALVVMLSIGAHAAALVLLTPGEPVVQMRGGAPARVVYTSAGDDRGQADGASRSALPAEVQSEAEAEPEADTPSEPPEAEPLEAKPVDPEPEPLPEAPELERPERAVDDSPDPAEPPQERERARSDPSAERARTEQAEPVDETRPLSGSGGDPQAVPQEETGDTGETGGAAAPASFSEADQHAAIQSEAGNAASDNYAGEVMRHLSRVRRPRATAPGVTQIAFVVAADGSLEAVEVVRSSGSGRFDRDALRVVERAAPFPEPPRGANRSFSVEIEGR